MKLIIFTIFLLWGVLANCSDKKDNGGQLLGSKIKRMAKRAHKKLAILCDNPELNIDCVNIDALKLAIRKAKSVVLPNFDNVTFEVDGIDDITILDAVTTADLKFIYFNKKNLNEILPDEDSDQQLLLLLLHEYAIVAKVENSLNYDISNNWYNIIIEHSNNCKESQRDRICSNKTGVFWVKENSRFDDDMEVKTNGARGIIYQNGAPVEKKNFKFCVSVFNTSNSKQKCEKIITNSNGEFLMTKNLKVKASGSGSPGYPKRHWIYYLLAPDGEIVYPDVARPGSKAINRSDGAGMLITELKYNISNLEINFYY